MTRTSSASAEWVQLPASKPFSWHSISFQYGAGAVAAHHCGLVKTPVGEIGQWQHGWIPKEHQVHPELVIPKALSQDKLWVARKDEESYLREHGCIVRAIGLPIAYTEESKRSRRPQSLLLVPPHTSNGTDQSWNEDSFAKYIIDQQDRFSSTVVCVHSSCVESGKWIATLEQHGIAWITGAHHQDGNSLQRMRDIFSQFEFVNICGFSSAIGYAAAFGAKVSITDSFFKLDLSTCGRVTHYQDFPGILERAAELMTDDAMRKRWPHFFVAPEMASAAEEWGKHQIGWDRRLTPIEMQEAFGWDGRTRLRRSAKAKTKNLIRKMLPKPIRTWMAESRRGPDPNETKWAPLEANPELRQLEIDGRQFHFTQPETFRGTYQHIFERDFYRIPVVIEQPTILDCGANIGLATRYWLEKYPKARIIAFEPDPQLFQVLEKNCNEVPDANVELCCAAVWNENATLSFASTGMETGALQDSVEIPEGESIDVKAVDLSDFLQERVDFLKLNIKGAECDVIPSLDGKLDHVMAMYIEYHSYEDVPQRLGYIIKVLETNGFRHAVDSHFVSKQPMRRIETNSGRDMQLDIWAWK